MNTCYVLYVSLIIVTIVYALIYKKIDKKIEDVKKAVAQEKKETDRRFEECATGVNELKQEVITISKITSTDVDKVIDIANNCIDRCSELEKKIEESSKGKSKKAKKETVKEK